MRSPRAARPARPSASPRRRSSTWTTCSSAPARISPSSPTSPRSSTRTRLLARPTSQAFADERFSGVGAASLDGNLYCFSSGLTSTVNIADRAYFLRTVGTRDLGVGDYQIGRSSGIDSIGLGYPVTNEAGELTGVTISPLSLPWLERRIGRQASAKSVDNLVIDDHGTVLARSGRTLTPIGTNLGRSKLEREMLAEDFGTGRFTLKGQRVEAAWGVVPLSDGEIHVSVSVPK